MHNNTSVCNINHLITAYADPLNCDLTHMFVHLFKDELNEYLYEADLAGLRMGVSNTANGISVSVELKNIEADQPANFTIIFPISLPVISQRIQ